MGSYNDQQHALTTALDTRSQMAEPYEWEIDVWDNLGWHCRIYRGNVSLHIHRCPHKDIVSYSCLISDDPDSASGGMSAWTTRKSRGATPQAEVDAAVREVFNYVKSLDAPLKAALAASSLCL